MKAEELRGLTVDELTKKEAELRRQLLTARIAQAKQQLKNPLQLRNLRRDIARVLTVRREKSGASQAKN